MTQVKFLYLYSCITLDFEVFIRFSFRVIKTEKHMNTHKTGILVFVVIPILLLANRILLFQNRIERN